MNIHGFKKRYPELVNKKPWIIFIHYGACAHCQLPISLISPRSHQKFDVYGFIGYKKILFTIDHIIPQSKGGTHLMTNLQALCSPCNNKKGDQSESHFYRPECLPADYVWQMHRRHVDKKSTDFYPDWKPYYGL